jgi:aminomethyltransferase
MVEADLGAIKFYRSAQTAVAGIDALVSRTGYTGEDGFELYVDASDGVELFDALVEEGEDWDLSLCGLGARDTLRLEAMLNLYGQDIDESTNPYEARLGWVVKLDKETSFVGRDALAAIKERGPDRRLRGLVLEGRGVIRPGYTIQIDGTEVGQVTSGSFAPTLEQSIGLGYIDAEFSDASEVDVVIRGREVPASVTRKPFYKADE